MKATTHHGQSWPKEPLRKALSPPILLIPPNPNPTGAHRIPPDARWDSVGSGGRGPPKTHQEPPDARWDSVGSGGRGPPKTLQGLPVAPGALPVPTRSTAIAVDRVARFLDLHRKPWE